VITIYTGTAYYLLPEWAGTLDNYFKVMKGAREVELERLCETRSRAPVFFESDIVKETVRFEEMPVMLPVDVQILPDRREGASAQRKSAAKSFDYKFAAAAYSAELAQTSAVKKKADFCLSPRAKNFWAGFQRIRKRLEQQIRTGRLFTAEWNITRLYADFFGFEKIETDFFEGKYTVVFYNESFIYSCAAYYLIVNAPNGLAEWAFFNSPPRGFGRVYVDQELEEQMRFQTVLEDDRPILIKCLTDPALKDDASMDAAVRILKYHLGGRTVDCLADIEFRKKGRQKMLSLSGLIEAFAAYMAKEELTEPEWYAERSFTVYGDDDAVSAIPNRPDVVRSVTTMPELIAEPDRSIRRCVKELKKAGVVTGYLTLPLAGFDDDDEGDEQLSAVATAVELNLAQSCACISLGMSLGLDNIYLEYMVFDIAGFVYALRSMSPLLTAFNITFSEYLGPPQVVGFGYKLEI